MNLFSRRRFDRFSTDYNTIRRENRVTEERSFRSEAEREERSSEERCSEANPRTRPKFLRRANRRIRLETGAACRAYARSRAAGIKRSVPRRAEAAARRTKKLSRRRLRLIAADKWSYVILSIWHTIVFYVTSRYELEAIKERAERATGRARATPMKFHFIGGDDNALSKLIYETSRPCSSLSITRPITADSATTAQLLSREIVCCAK